MAKVLEGPGMDLLQKWGIAVPHHVVVTYDFARLMEGAKEIKCSEFSSEIIKNTGQDMTTGFAGRSA